MIPHVESQQVMLGSWLLVAVGQMNFQKAHSQIEAHPLAENLTETWEPDQSSG